jgi:hypothetical protein
VLAGVNACNIKRLQNFVADVWKIECVHPALEALPAVEERGALGRESAARPSASVVPGIRLCGQIRSLHQKSPWCTGRWRERERERERARENRVEVRRQRERAGRQRGDSRERQRESESDSERARESEEERARARSLVQETSVGHPALVSHRCCPVCLWRRCSPALVWVCLGNQVSRVLATSRKTVPSRYEPTSS